MLAVNAGSAEWELFFSFGRGDTDDAPEDGGGEIGMKLNQNVSHQINSPTNQLKRIHSSR